MKRFLQSLLVLLIPVLVLISCKDGGTDERPEDIPEYKPPKDQLRESVPPYESPVGTVFTYQDKFAGKVTLEGNFNNWNPRLTPLKQNKFDIWIAVVPLKKGTYTYLFNVDGKSVLDPKNFRKVSNDLGDKRSVVVVTNGVETYFRPVASGYEKAFPPRHKPGGIEFTYKDFNAGSVCVAGDFNGWKKGQYPMKMNDNGVWDVTVPLDKGRYKYKFFVETSWIRDPENPDTGYDDFGQEFSLLNVTDNFIDKDRAPHVIDRIPYRFTYRNENIPSRYRIAVIGDWNGWDDTRDFLYDRDQDKTWEGIVYLAEGTYLYRFKIADEEFADPYNRAEKTHSDGRPASYLKLSPAEGNRAVRFTYRDYSGRKIPRIFLTGDFNNWDLENTPMRYDRDNDYWYVVTDMPPGIYKYQFFVNGRFEVDRTNPNIVADRNGISYSVIEIK